jgi:hypothetical protein
MTEVWNRSDARRRACILCALAAVLLVLSAAICFQTTAVARERGAVVAVGPQYDSTHVYIAPGDFDDLVNSITATFGGQASKRIVSNVLPVPSSTEFQAVWTPSGTFSIFAYQTPIPSPFGEERTGYLVTNMDNAIRAARAAGPR